MRALLTLMLLLCVATDARDLWRGESRHVLHARGLASVPRDCRRINAGNVGATVRTVWIALTQRNVDKLDEVIIRVSDPRSVDYGKHYSYDELQAIFAPPRETSERVLAWLREGGVPDNAVHTTGDSIRVTLSTAVIDALFGGESMAFYCENTDQRVVASIGEWSIPASLADDVVMVAGLSDFPFPKRSPSALDLDAADKTDYSHSSAYSKSSTISNGPAWPMNGRVVPSTVRNLYNISADVKASNLSTTQAAVQFLKTNCFAQSDMTSYMKNVGFNAVDVAHIINEDTWNDTVCRSVGAGESVLDLDMLLSTGYGAQTWYWGGNQWIYDWTQQYLALPKASAPLVSSLSWGWLEDATCSIAANCSQMGVNNEVYVLRSNVELGKLAAMGYTILAATQDEGAPSVNNNEDCSNTTTPVTPIWPSSSPYVLAVGATTLLDPTSDDEPALPREDNPPSAICSKIHCSRGTVETTAMAPNAGFTSGGGFSLYADRPAWQNATVSKWLAGDGYRPAAKFFNGNGRGYPDISAVGDAVYTYSAHAMGRFSGGTSASTPIVAGVLSLLNDHLLNAGMAPLGFVNPLIYMMGEAGVFNDITTGNNTCTGWGAKLPCCPGAGYAAVPGWDPATGWGTPNYGKMIEFLDAHVITPRKQEPRSHA